jgi:hypothetical protein
MGLYRKFTEMPELIGGDPVISSFMASQVGQPLAQMYAVRKNFVEIYDNPGLNTQLQNLAQQTETILTDMENLQPLIETDPQAWTDWTSLIGQLAALEQAAIQLLDQWTTELIPVANAVRNENNTINCTSQACVNEQFLHNLFLETGITNSRAVTSNEQAQIKTIAESCPENGGPAVYLARTWYYWLTEEKLQDNCIAPLPSTESIEEREDSKSFTEYLELNIQPNPAKEWITIELPNLDEEAELYIRDAWGRILRQISVTDSGQQTMQLSTTGFASGVYSVSLLSTTGKPLSTVKMVVAH